LALLNMRKAFELKDRASEREKLAITSDYYSYSGQIEKAIGAYETYKQAYPRDTRPLINLATEYLLIGQFEKALQNALAAKELNPNQFNGYAVASFSYLAMNRLDEAKAIMNAALQNKIGSAVVHEQLAMIAFEQGDQATFAKERALVEASPQGQYDFLQFEASLAAARGQLKKAHELFGQLEDKAKKLELSDAVVNAITSEAMADAMQGSRAAGLAGADAALKKSQAPTTLLSVADIYARSGEEAKAEKLIAQAAGQRPDDEMMQSVYVPIVQAVLAMNHHDAGKAVELLKKAAPYDAANTECLYTRASALLMAGQGAEAEKEFQRTLNLRTSVPTDLLVSLAQLGLARAYVAEGDKVKGRTGYQDFLGNWKVADPELPLLKQAQAEYAEVQ
jgi:tetratricopeptide (TPR) repeat protein